MSLPDKFIVFLGRTLSGHNHDYSMLTCIPHIVVRVGAAVFVKTYPLAMLTLIGGYF